MKKSKKNYKVSNYRKKYSKVGGLSRILSGLNIGYDLSIDNLYKFLESCTYDDLTMIIGVDYMYLKDINRYIEKNNSIDFGWTYEVKDRQNPSTRNNWYQINHQFNMDFGSTDIFILSKNFEKKDRLKLLGREFSFIEKQKKYNKFKKIIFDSSTIKFLNNTIFINYLYYFLLTLNGELYFEPQFLTGIISFIHDTHQINGITKKNIDDLRDQINLLTPIEYGNNYYIKMYTTYSETKPLRQVDYNIINNNNIEYFKKHLLYSKVEYIENISTEISMNDEMGNQIKIWQNDKYPIKFTNYPIGSYYKITKSQILNLFELPDISDIINSFDVSKTVYF